MYPGHPSFIIIIIINLNSSHSYFFLNSQSKIRFLSIFLILFCFSPEKDLQTLFIELFFPQNKHTHIQTHRHQ